MHALTVHALTLPIQDHGKVLLNPTKIVQLSRCQQSDSDVCELFILEPAWYHWELIVVGSSLVCL